MKKIYSLIFICCLGFGVQAQTINYTNGTNINIADNSTATLYSSDIQVSGAPSTITDIAITLNGFTHSVPGDVAIAIESPSGQAMIIQDGFWSSFPASNLTYMLSDIGGSQPGQFDLPSSGTFKPTANSSSLPSFDLPGPGMTYANPGPSNAGTATFASVYGGSNPNGVWKLWIIDISAGGMGNISNGWTLTINPTVPLPVDLSGLSATCMANEQIEVSWITHNEENTKSFVIQSSSDGSFFNDDKEIKAAGNSNMEMKYSVLIPHKYEEQFVRLKSVDLNGQFDYSNVMEVNCSNDLPITVSPNPFTGSFYLNNPGAEFVQYEVIDINGKVLQSGRTTSIKEKIDLAEAAKGMYYLKMIKNNQSTTLKLFNQ